jgi:hypothetical protein
MFAVKNFFDETLKPGRDILVNIYVICVNNKGCPPGMLPKFWGAAIP